MFILETDSAICPYCIALSCREECSGKSEQVAYLGIYHICDLTVSRVGKPPLVAAVSEAGGLGIYLRFI
jgi:hypothetical protein